MEYEFKTTSLLPNQKYKYKIRLVNLKRHIINLAGKKRPAGQTALKKEAVSR